MEVKVKKSELINKSPQTLLLSSALSSVLVPGYGKNDLIRDITAASNLNAIFTTNVLRLIGIDYIRDIFQEFPEQLVLTPSVDTYTVLKKILGNSEANKNIVISKLGVGGKVLRSGNLVLLSEQLRESKYLFLLKNLGYNIDFVPVPSLKDQSVLGARMSLNSHIDTEINIIKSAKGYSFLVNKDYFVTYRRAIDRLANKYAREVLIISSPLEQTLFRGVNFIELPDGRVIIPENCRETRSLLEKSLGKEKVIPVQVDFSKAAATEQVLVEGKQTTVYSHGGLRCLTNLATL